jgi:hypothetical protein
MFFIDDSDREQHIQHAGAATGSAYSKWYQAKWENNTYTAYASRCRRTPNGHAILSANSPPAQMTAWWRRLIFLFHAAAFAWRILTLIIDYDDT